MNFSAAGVTLRRWATANWYVAPAAAQGGIGSDSNSGTSPTAPFATIEHAGSVVSAGQIVSVAPGTYLGGSIFVTANGTSGNPITYRSEVPYAAKIVGNNTSTSNNAAFENRGNFVIIQGFEIDGSGAAATPWRIGIYNGGSDCTILNNLVHDILVDPTAYAAAVSSGNGGAGILNDSFYGGLRSGPTGNIVYNIGQPGHSDSVIQGIYQSTSGNILNNQISTASSCCIQTWHDATSVNIFNNTCDGGGAIGILVGASTGTNNNSTVRNNIISNCANGLSEQGTTGTSNVYSNNLLYNVPGYQIQLQNGLTATATVTGNPLFVDRTNRDFRLSSGSPAIDAGSATGAPATDIVGTKRPRGAGHDIGCFESA